jgi:hypothetical protein
MELGGKLGEGSSEIKAEREIERKDVGKVEKRGDWDGN